MSTYERNVYYNPEAWGLTPIAEYQDPHACYDFDIVVAWANEQGHVYAARSSGCSCPTPFEEYDDIWDLHRIREVDDLDYLLPSAHTMTTADKIAFKRKVRDYLYVEARVR